MSRTCKLVYAKDLLEANVEEVVGKIKTGNIKLYEAIVTNLQRDNSLGIREDVLRYMAQNIAEFRIEQEFVHNMAELVSNVKVTPECVKWINEYFSDEVPVDVNDFVIVFNEAIEKDIPLTEIKSLFMESNDILEIYQKVEEYVKAEVKEAVPEEETIVAGEQQISVVQTQPEIEPRKEENEYGDVVANLITVMMNRSNDEAAIIEMKEKMNAFLAEQQSLFSRMSAFSAEIMRLWEKDKEEKERLEALLRLQQKMMLNQQRKINELRNENEQLNEQLQSASRAKRQLQVISRNLAEYEAMPEDNLQNCNPSYISVQ